MTRRYEIDGRDYPYAYVRWTQNRNMAAYLDLVANGAIDVNALIDEIVPIDRAPAAYDALARSKNPPLGVVLAYLPDAQVDLDSRNDRSARQRANRDSRCPQAPQSTRRLLSRRRRRIRHLDARSADGQAT